MAQLINDYGLLILFLLVAAESGGMCRVPGETALIAAGVAASQGHLDIVWVIVVAAIAAIIGDNIGYCARAHGRAEAARALRRWTRRMRRQRTCRPTQRFFNAHGGKTIFLARFVAVLRVSGAWIAGITHMPWWRFFVWNAAGGIAGPSSSASSRTTSGTRRRTRSRSRG